MKLAEQQVQEFLEYLTIHPIFPPPIMNPEIIYKSLNGRSPKSRAKPTTIRSLLRFFMKESARQLQMIVDENIISRTEFHLRKRATMEEMSVYKRLSDQVNERIKRK
ncbi:17785_t:CDS:1 [Funneliformis geosporum]|uniref:8563_t:CDS:1 n=1 Tax=Funneliformis geosporum TaxID=1117311 RepID=A0A9W4WT81_9GLOM|nr:17785_t:CDS:1 [Funneliformis geosporum]CAI2177059.1 8563_t:CDS:1 [Funneliformis geosporum]